MRNIHEITRSFSNAAVTYDSHAFIQREIADRLLSRLDYMRFSPNTICDLGSGTGYGASQLLERFPQASVTACDIALPMLSRIQHKALNTAPVCTDAHQMPFADETFDLIFCNLLLQWCHHPKGVLKECQRLLKPSGILLFSTFGPDTLKEIRDSWAKVDENPHVIYFPDMHLIGDALLKLQFLDPVMDTETLTIEYDNPKAVFEDIKKIGAHNLHAERHKGLTGKAKFQSFLEHFKAHRLDGGQYPLTYEVVYGLAFRGRYTAVDPKRLS